MVVPRPMLDYSLLLTWRWMPPATYSLRMNITIASARWEPMGLSPRWRATGTTPEPALEAIPATEARRPMLNCIFHHAWRWTPQAISSLRIREIMSSAKSEPMGLLPRWRATVTLATKATEA